MNTVSLTKEDLDQCREWEKKANERKQNGKSLMPTTGNFQSFCGYLAFSKLLNIPWEPRVDDSIDVIKGNSVLDCRVRIGNRKYNNLFVRTKDLAEASYVVLGFEDKGTFIFPKYIETLEVPKFEFKSWLPAPAYVLEDKDLKPIEELIEKLKGAPDASI